MFNATESGYEHTHGVQAVHGLFGSGQALHRPRTAEQCADQQRLKPSDRSFAQRTNGRSALRRSLAIGPNRCS